MLPLVADPKTLLGDVPTLVSTALRVAVVYAVLLGLLQLGGHRTLGQLTPFDLVTLLPLSNVVQNAMIGPDLSLTLEPYRRAARRGGAPRPQPPDCS